MSRYDVKMVASSDDVTVAVHDLGGQGPPLLFCHATGFCGPVWAPLAQGLHHQYHCYALDFRAHGLSSAPVHGHMGWSGMVDDLLAVAKLVSPGEPIRAVGHSLGGGVIVLAEATVPGTIDSAWTFEPILFPMPPPDEPADGPHDTAMSQTARHRRSVFVDRADVYQRYRARTPLNQLDPRCLQAYVEHGFRDRADGSVELACSPEYEARTFEQHRTGASDRAGELDIPLVLAIGGEDTVPVEAVVEVAKRNPRLRLLRYPDLTHFGPLQAPERIASDIARWFTTA